MIVPGGESRGTVDGNVTAESGMSKRELEVFEKGAYMEMSPGGVSPLMRRRQAS